MSAYYVGHTIRGQNSTICSTNQIRTYCELWFVAVYDNGTAQFTVHAGVPAASDMHVSTVTEATAETARQHKTLSRIGRTFAIVPVLSRKLMRGS